MVSDAVATREELDDAVRLTVAVNLRRLRRARQWSQEVLAHFAGLHPTMVSRLEAQQRGASVLSLFRVAAALDVGLDELLCDVDDGPQLREVWRRGGGGSVG